MKNKSYVMHVLSHTHWDREWYQDFQGFRQRLVFQMDALMDLLEKRPEYKYFHLDGQTICLEDYLQIRPQSRERLEGHIRSGQILIGPWYCMPDELLLSGESLVRNLLLGHRICAQFGVDPMPVGYVSDIFGHCSQFPQIVRGFGIDTVFLHRGTSNADGASEMLWEGADGSRVLIIKAYPYTGYNDFLAYRSADEKILLEYEKNKKAFAATRVLYALEGNDHTPAYYDTPECIERVNGIFEEIECVHSSMVEYLKALKSELGDWANGELVRHKGELRTPLKAGMYAELFCGTASSRVNLKQQNDRLEYLLPRVAEPLHAWSVMFGGDDQKPFLDLAWQYLLMNHPHDSIVGCSVDQVHRDMIYRFDQARLLVQNSIRESVVTVSDRLDTASLGESDAVVTVFNPSSVDSGPVTKLSFEVFSPVVEEKAKQGLVPVLSDEQGNAVYFEVDCTDTDMWPDPQVKKYREGTPCFSMRANMSQPHHRFHVNVAGSVPAMGYKSWAVKFMPEETAKSVPLPQEISPVSTDADSRTLENEYLRVVVREDGLIDIYDKPTDTWYRDLLDMEDCGDNGTGWDHIHPENDTVIKASDPGVKDMLRMHIEQTGQLTAHAYISYMLKVPCDLAPDRKSRSEHRFSFMVDVSLTLTAGSRKVECETIVNNVIKSHRLRALFPTQRKADTWFGDSAFDLVERPIKLMDTTGWQEQVREETPIKNLAAVQDDKSGFAVITKGLCEACVQDSADRTLALTLFRSFEQQIGDGWTKDSQFFPWTRESPLPGLIKLEYSIVPFTPDGSNPPVHLFSEVEKYKLDMVPITSAAHPGDMSPSGSFLTVPDGLVVSTIKRSEDGVSTIIRLFNPSDSEVSGIIRTHTPIPNACKCDLLERNLEALPVIEGGAYISLKAKEAATYRI